MLCQTREGQRREAAGRAEGAVTSLLSRTDRNASCFGRLAGRESMTYFGGFPHPQGSEGVAHHRLEQILPILSSSGD